MRYLLFFSLIITVLSACSTIQFEEPLPTNIKAIQSIPEVYRGVYTHEEDTIVVGANSFTFFDYEFSLNDKNFLKPYGNKHFLVVKTDDGYSVYILEKKNGSIIVSGVTERQEVYEALIQRYEHRKLEGDFFMGWVLNLTNDQFFEIVDRGYFNEKVEYIPVN